MQIDYAKEIPEVKNILEKYDLFTNFKYFLSHELVLNYRNKRFHPLLNWRLAVTYLRILIWKI
jgi:hypothetical protein